MVLVNLVVILVVLVVADVVDNTTTLVVTMVARVVTVPVELVVVLVVPVGSSSNRTRPRCTIMVVAQVQFPGSEAEHASLVVVWGTG